MPAWGTQRAWRWCDKCEGMWFGGGKSSGTCPAGGSHVKKGSGNYSLVHQAATAPANHQDNWRWCSKCQGLWFGGQGNNGKCPAGGSHVKKGSGNYAIAHQTGAGQSGWRWCSKCLGMWFGGHSGSVCPAGGAHSAAKSGAYRIPFVSSTVRIHTKTLTAPDVSIPQLFQNMREVYATAGIDVEWRSEETLDLPALNDLEVGTCSGASSVTAEQTTLFGNRDNVGTSDIAVYFVRSTNPPLNGCAACPANRPSAVCVRTASQWTFAHEVGHILDLTHVNNNDRLMTGNGTFNITNAPPDLVASEVTTMQADALTVSV